MALQFYQEWQETIQQSDSAVLGIGLSISDSLSMADGLTYFETIKLAANNVGGAAWIVERLPMSYRGDAFVTSIGLQITDSLLLIDTYFYRHGSTIASTNPDSILDGDSLFSNQKDAFKVVVSLGLAFSDNLNLWLDPQLNTVDSSLLNPGVSPQTLSDQLTMSDSLLLGIGDQISDQMFLNDVSGYGYEPYGQAPFGGFVQNGEFLGFGNLIAEAMSMVDGIVLTLGFVTSLTDTLSLTDILAIGYGNQLSDALSMSDADIAMELGGSFTYELLFLNTVTVATGSAGSEQLLLSDATVLGLGLLLNDQLTLSDAAIVATGILLSLSDQLTLSDQQAQQLSIASSLSDTLTMSDFLSGLGYGQVIAEALTLSDALVLGYGDQLVDSLTLSDSLILGYSDVLSDQLPMGIPAGGYGTEPYGGAPYGEIDILLLGYGDQLTDQLSLSDSLLLGLGVGKLLADTLTLSDSLALGYGLQPADTLLLTDFVLANIGLIISETLTLVDSPVFGIGLRISDQLILSDAFASTLGQGGANLVLNLNDQLPMGILAGGYGTEPYGGAPYGEMDSIIIALLRASDLLLSVADQLPMGILAGGYGTEPYGQAPYGEMDYLLLGYGDLFTENLVLSDAFRNTIVPLGYLTDGLTMSDQLSGIGYGDALADLLTLSDNLNFTFSGVVTQMTLSDVLALSDFVNLYVSMQMPTDTLTMSDVFAFNLINVPAMQQTYADSLVLSDKMVLGYGLLIPEALVLSDSLLIEYDLLITDHLTMVDFYAMNFLQLPLFDGLTETDSIALGFGNALVDTLSLADQLTGVGFGFVLGDIVTNTTQQTQDTFNRANETPLNPSSWATISGVAELQIVADKCEATSIGGVGSAEFNISIPWPSDQFAGVTLAGSALGGEFDIWLRAGIDLGSGTVTGYDFGFVDNGNGTGTATITILFAGGTKFIIWKNPILPFSPGDNFLAAVLGRVLVFYQNGQMIGWVNDTTFTSGQAGLYLFVQTFLSDMQLTNFVGGLTTSQLADQLLLSYGSLIAETLVLSDAFVLSYGDILTDSLVMADAVATFLPVAVIAPSDTLSMSDNLLLGIGDLIAEQLTLTDSAIALFPVGSVFTDQLTLTDQKTLGYGFLVADTLSMSDVFGSVINSLAPSDQLVLSDFFTGQLLGPSASIFPADTFVLSDSFSMAISGLVVSDQMISVDQLALGYGNKLSDQLTMSDQLSFGYVLSQTPADSLTLSDALGLGFGFLDQLTLSEVLTIAYGNVFVDQMAMQESLTLGLSVRLVDQMIMAEQLGAGYGNAVSDQITTQADSAAFVEGMLVLIAEATPTMLDALGRLLSTSLVINDTVVLQDQLATGWGILTGNESLSMLDQLTPSLQYLIALGLQDDNEANWLDILLTALVFAPTDIVIGSLSILQEVISNLQILQEVQVGSLAVESELLEAPTGSAVNQTYNFTIQTDQNPLDPTFWSPSPLFIDELQVKNGMAVAGTLANACGMMYTGAPFPADQTSEILLGNMTPDFPSFLTNAYFVDARESAAGCYEASIDVPLTPGGATNIFLYTLFSDGSTNVLGSWTGTIQAGEAVAVTAKGTTISVTINGVAVITVRDSTFTSGQPGFGVDEFLSPANTPVLRWSGYGIVSENFLVHYKPELARS